MNPKWLAELLNSYAETLRLLSEIQAATGYGYKRLTELQIDHTAPCPGWCDGIVTMAPSHEARSIAHEMGHGLHEKIRETGKADEYGEDFAEAIRWFVEERMGPGSWCNGLKNLPHKSAVLKA